ncbi:MAG TPA: DGQHR domain-containing protein [Rhizomicrobium sp.]|nr:DGQHR domain-containing protein [Rhizomicrobium sp.]
MAKTAKTKLEKGKKSSAIKAPKIFKCSPVQQDGKTLYVFAAKASELYSILSINRKIEDKEEGYQRTLSLSRVEAIAKHIERKNPIPTSIVVAFDQATFNAKSGELTVPAGKDVGWVIDGQHRLAGAHQAAARGVDIELSVVAFAAADEKEQIQQFVTINREAKGVPTSLYLDLLRHLPNKDMAEVLKERTADIARELKSDEESPFYDRIPATASPKVGQISLTNFVRKISPLLAEKSTLGIYTEKEQRAVIVNYYTALRNVFPDEYRKADSVFFRTIGFGALWNAFPVFFSLCLKEHQGFQVKDANKVFKKIETFDFSDWRELGTGSAAEIQAGNDLKTALRIAFDEGGGASQLRL